MKPHDLHNLDGCINTYSSKETGLKFNIFEPTPEMINEEDIGKGLANNSHFGGQLEGYFSIAEHCLLVYTLLPDADRVLNPERCLYALLHDGSEAYTGDIKKPIKVRVPQFQVIEDSIQMAICMKYQLDPDLKYYIKSFDIKAQDMEFQDFYVEKVKDRLEYLTPEDAYYRWLKLVKRFIAEWDKKRTFIEEAGSEAINE